ncbi:MAG: MFS transporter [Alphaproteobacteria bacterium]|nr:MFS transporter [Alphaproteobacteria bacterium]
MSRNSILVFVNAAHFFDHFFLLIFPTAALAIASAWAMSYADTLVLGTPLYVMFAVGTLPAGWLGDRVDRVILIILFFLGCGASSLMIALSTGSTLLSIGLGLLGLFAAIYHPVGIALVTDVGKRTGRALAVNGVSGNLGLAAAAVITALLADRFGWRSAFAVPGILSILIGAAMFASSRRRPDRTDTAGNVPKDARIPVDTRTQMIIFGVVCVAALFGGSIFNAVTISLPKFFDERLVAATGGLTWVGASTGLVFTIAAFAQLPVGELLDRFGAKPILSSLLAAQALLLLVLSQATGWFALVTALILVTSIFAAIPVTGWLIGHYIPTGLRSRIMSVEYVLSLGMASAIVPIISFMHRNGQGFDIQLVFLAVAAAIVFVAALWLPGRDNRTSGAQAEAAE